MLWRRGCWRWARGCFPRSRYSSSTPKPSFFLPSPPLPLLSTPDLPCPLPFPPPYSLSLTAALIYTQYVDLKRRFFALVLGAAVAKVGEDKAMKMAADGGIKADELLAGDKEDGDLRDFLKSKNLAKCP
mmetsp:Transcript_28791/g.91941  ORF Transcript_28791/g.91941 Transcript_28791/m.91941 type:complete len:129 (-) Transcript_28791:97-483(-)